MLIGGRRMRTIWLEDDGAAVGIIDQRFLPFETVFEKIATVDEMVEAIKDMHLRGAPLIGSAAAYGVYLAAYHAPKTLMTAFEEAVKSGANELIATRPTAVNLAWAVGKTLSEMEKAAGVVEKIRAALKTANQITEQSVAECRRIGEYGADILAEIARRKAGARVNILTHCNAGWLACVDYGTATAPVYVARERGIDVHVYVDETRPRNQGAFLTAFELLENGVPHTVIPDNAGGHLMQHGLVDAVIVGSDRTTGTGDVANKIGTYLKALAARDNGVPFYVALPTSTIDRSLSDGVSGIPIERRSPDEVKYITGLTREGKRETVLVTPEKSPAENYGFDVTPARLVTALITEKGVCPATKEGIDGLF